MHSKQCLAAAIIAAVENLRDYEGTDNLSFRLDVQNNVPLGWADSYLSDGTMTCTCGEYAMEELLASFQRAGNDPEAIDSVQFEANLALKRGTINPTQYMVLARRCHDFTKADSKPLPEDVEGHAMWGPFTHDDGRVCCYHQRLGVWVLDDTTQCLRSDHPTLASLMRPKS